MIVSAIGIGILFFSIYRFRLHWNDRISNVSFWGTLIIKLLGATVFGLVYHYYYEVGDSLFYFHEAKKFSTLPIPEHLSYLAHAELGSQHPRTHAMIKVVSVVNRLSFQNYWVANLYFASISFMASWYFILKGLKPSEKRLGVIASFLIPSIVFWSSGLGKDTLANAALLIITACLLNFCRTKRITTGVIILTCISLITLYYIRHYLLISSILFASLLFLFQSRHKWVAAGVFLVGLLAMNFIHPYLNMERLPLTIYEINQSFSTRIVAVDEPSWSEVLIKSMNGLWTGLFRPGFMDRVPLIGVGYMLENLTWLTCSILTLIIIFNYRVKTDLKLVVPALLSIFILTILVTLSTPNFGSLMRYKSAWLPFLFLLIGHYPLLFVTKQRNTTPLFRRR